MLKVIHRRIMKPIVLLLAVVITFHSSYFSEEIRLDLPSTLIVFTIFLFQLFDFCDTINCKFFLRLIASYSLRSLHANANVRIRLYLHVHDVLTALLRLKLLPSGIVVERSPVQGFAADCCLFMHLGFDLMNYTLFFLLSPHSRLGLFHPYVVAGVSQRPSNSIRYTHTSPYAQTDSWSQFQKEYPILQCRNTVPLHLQNYNRRWVSPKVLYWVPAIDSHVLLTYVATIGSFTLALSHNVQTISSFVLNAHHFDLRDSHPRLCNCALLLLAYVALYTHGIVVERSPIRGFAADCPIHAVF